MGLFDKLSKILNPEMERQPQEKQSGSRKDIDSTQIDDMQKIPASEKYRERIYKKYYRSHPIKPFISLDREKNTNWIEQAEQFPKQAVIPIKMMTPYSDGLLPGHVYLLYWIDKNGKRKVPSYFEYKYGIEFEKEKCFLISNGYLSDNKPTEKGYAVINAHFDVIEAHSPEMTSAKKAQEKFAADDSISIEQNAQDSSFSVTKVRSVDGRDLMLVAESDREKICVSVELINALLQMARKKLKIREPLCIPTDELVFNSSFSQKLYSYFEYSPLTSSGKASKYPFTLHIATKKHYDASPEFECFGSISYLKDNRVGSATLNFWYKNKGYHVSLGLIGDMLSIKKVDKSINGTKTTVYKK